MIWYLPHITSHTEPSFVNHAFTNMHGGGCNYKKHCIAQSTQMNINEPRSKWLVPKRWTNQLSTWPSFRTLQGLLVDVGSTCPQTCALDHVHEVPPPFEAVFASSKRASCRVIHGFKSFARQSRFSNFAKREDMSSISQQMIQHETNPCTCNMPSSCSPLALPMWAFVRIHSQACQSLEMWMLQLFAVQFIRHTVRQDHTASKCLWLFNQFWLVM